jgi:hypothetical protein
MAVEKAGRHRGVTGIGDLRPNRAGGAGRLGKRDGAAGQRDHRSAGGGEGGGDAVSEAAAGADDDRGLAGQLAHDVLSVSER